MRRGIETAPTGKASLLAKGATMTAKASSEALIENLDKVAHEVLDYLAGPGRASDARVDRWQAREILMHFIYFHDATAWGIQSAAVGGPPWPVPADSDIVNEVCRRLHEHESFEELVAQLRRAHARLLGAARRAPDLDSAVPSALDGRGAHRAPAPRAPRPSLGRARAESSRPPPRPASSRRTARRVIAPRLPSGVERSPVPGSRPAHRISPPKRMGGLACRPRLSTFPRCATRCRPKSGRCGWTSPRAIDSWRATAGRTSSSPTSARACPERRTSSSSIRTGCSSTRSPRRAS